MGIFIPGLVVVLVFYVIIFGIGIWAAWRKRARGNESENQIMSIGRRDIGIILGTFTMTATWVGGGYINGLAEIIYTPGMGLLWAQGWFSLFIVLFIGGTFYAKKMRENGYITMLDPLQLKFGRHMGGLLCLPAVMGDVFWSAGILIALGGTLSVIVNVDILISVIISAVIAILYTLLGGIYSVAYTDVAQLALIFIGMWLSVGFAFVHPAVSDISTTSHDGPNWLGTWRLETLGSWIDTTFLVVFGGIPYQTYFQRVLATESAKKAQMVSYAAGFMTCFMGLPSVLLGAIAASTDWNQTEYKGIPFVNNQSSFVVPIAMRYLTPEAVSVFGLAAISAAVMSSIDSSLLSASSMFTRNVYKLVFRPKAGKKELTWVMRLSVVFFGCLATVFAVIVNSVYSLWFLSIDFIYVVLFPQLTCVLYLDPNIYGSIPAYIIGVILRVGGGDFYLKLDPFIHYRGGPNFPVKTFAMLVSLFTLMTVSWIARFLFANGIIPERYDFLKSNLAKGGRSLKLEDDTISSHSTEKRGELNQCYKDFDDSKM